MSYSFDIPLDAATIQQIAINGTVRRGGPVKAPLSPLAQRIKSYSRKHYKTMYANDFSVLNPVIWANEAILQLQPNMVLGNLINRDFSNQVARFGDIVHALVPGTFQMNRKGATCDNIVIQDGSASSLQVALNQWPTVSFDVCDGEEDRSALDLVDTMLVPAVIALAQGIDRILAAQVHQFDSQGSGHLGLMTSSNVRDYILDARETMTRNNVPLLGRSMIIGPNTDTEALSLDSLVTAEKVGDGGTTLQTAILGERYGFQFVTAQSAPEVHGGQTTINTTLAAAAGIGATTVTVASATGIVAGQWLTIAGDDKPNQVSGVASAVLTLRYALTRSVASGAAVVIVAPGTVNLSGGYVGTQLSPRVIGWVKPITVAGFANSAPQIGQSVSFGTDTNIYSIIGLNIINASNGDFQITLDQPLVNAIANSAAVNLGPAGKYNFALLPNAFTLVNRPLPAPRTGTGASAKTVSDPINKISLRVTIGYDLYKQAHIVTIDTLMGVGVLNKALGATMFG